MSLYSECTTFNSSLVVLTKNGSHESNSVLLNIVIVKSPCRTIASKILSENKNVKPITPTVLIHGTSDRRVDALDSCEAWKDMGANAELCLIDGAVHGFDFTQNRGVSRVISEFFDNIIVKGTSNDSTSAAQSLCIMDPDEITKKCKELQKSSN